MPRIIETRDLRIFGDESSHTGDKDFLTYGTLSCDRKNLNGVIAKLESASSDSLSELKWNYLTKRNRGRYRRFATAICELLKGNGPLWYRYVVIPIRESIYRDDPKKGIPYHVSEVARTGQYHPIGACLRLPMIWRLR